jgi:hypothetical protein
MSFFISRKFIGGLVIGTLRTKFPLPVTVDTVFYISLMPSPLSRTRREGIWTSVYSARVARAAYNARQSDAQIKSHDCAGTKGMQYLMTVCVLVRTRCILWVPNEMLIYSHFLFMHTRNT